MVNNEERVYVTRKLPKAVMKQLHDNFNVQVNSKDAILSKKELASEINNFKPKYVVSLLTDDIDQEILMNVPIKGIANYAVGYDNIDLEYTRKEGIMVTNTPGVLTETTADLAWSLLMAMARRVVEADKFCRNMKFEGWAPKLMLGVDVFGKTLGIIGMGRIGQAMARRARGFGMEIIYHSKTRKKELEKKYDYDYVELNTLFRKSDFISLHVPYTEQTHHIVDKTALFDLMKQDAILINTARGRCIDVEELVEALETKRIAGAALDVFYNEPKIHPRLLQLDNVILTPHIGSASIETREKMGFMVVDNLVAMKQGKKPPNLIL